MLISKSCYLLLIQCHLQKYSPLLQVLCFPCKYQQDSVNVLVPFIMCKIYNILSILLPIWTFKKWKNKCTRHIHNVMFSNEWGNKNTTKHPFPKPPLNTETTQIGVSWYDARGKLCFVCWEQAYAWEHVKWQGCVEQCLIVLSLQLVTDRVILIKSATV